LADEEDEEVHCEWCDLEFPDDGELETSGDGELVCLDCLRTYEPERYYELTGEKDEPTA